MKNLLRAELIKLRTTRTFAALASVAIGIALLITILVCVLSKHGIDDPLNDVFNNDTSSLFILILAVVGITGEWRHRTITSSLLAAPDRLRFLAAKVLAFAAAGIVLSVAISVSVAIVGYALLGIRDIPAADLGDVFELGWRNALVAGLLGAFGVGVGSLVRNQPVAIVGLFILIFVIEPTVLGLLPDYGRYGPLISAPSAITQSDIGFDEVDQLSAVGGVLVLLGWITLTAGLGGLLLRARDVD
jgi:ABC-type transport system involved in multi-copper enzyme maturation permease subunit